MSNQNNQQMAIVDFYEILTLINRQTVPSTYPLTVAKASPSTNPLRVDNEDTRVNGEDEDAMRESSSKATVQIPGSLAGL